MTDLEAIGKLLSERGYLVFAWLRLLSPGDIVTELGPGDNIPELNGHPFRVSAETDLADYAEQSKIAEWPFELREHPGPAAHASEFGVDSGDLAVDSRDVFCESITPAIITIEAVVYPLKLTVHLAAEHGNFSCDRFNRAILASDDSLLGCVDSGGDYFGDLFEVFCGEHLIQHSRCRI